VAPCRREDRPTMFGAVRGALQETPAEERRRTDVITAETPETLRLSGRMHPEPVRGVPR